MDYREVPIVYGYLPRLPHEPTYHEENRLFPYAREYETGGCDISSDDPATSMVFFCSECKKALFLWWANRFASWFIVSALFVLPLAYLLLKRRKMLYCCPSCNGLFKNSALKKYLELGDLSCRSFKLQRIRRSCPYCRVNLESKYLANRETWICLVFLMLCFVFPKVFVVIGLLFAYLLIQFMREVRDPKAFTLLNTRSAGKGPSSDL